MWRAKDFGERWHYLAIKSLRGSKSVWEPIGVYCAVQNKNLTLLFGFSDRWALWEGDILGSWQLTSCKYVFFLGKKNKKIKFFLGENEIKKYKKKHMNARNATC